MSKFSLKSFIRDHRLALVDVILLSLCESALFVAQFYVVGLAINGLLEESWKGIYILTGLFVAKLVVSYIKQIRINKAYTSMYEELITEAVGKPIEAGECLEELMPRSSIIYLMGDFFKTDMIRGFETLTRLIFVLISLFLLNKTVFLACLSFAIIVFLLYRLRQKQTITISQQLAQEVKKEYTILKKRNRDELYEHYDKLEKLDNRLSGISGINLSIIEILAFVLTVFSIVVLVKTEGQNAFGTFFALLYYVFAFSEAMFLLPSVYQQYLKIQQLSLTMKK